MTDYAVSKDLQVAMLWREDYTLDGEVPPKLIIANVVSNLVMISRRIN